MASYLTYALFLLLVASAAAESPTPAAWPLQFHSLLYVNYSGSLSMIDLWYDWTNGRNFNIVQDQLGSILYDLEWNNGTSFFYSLDSAKKCSSAQLEVGILRPNWLDGAEYLGQETVDGFLCNVWQKVQFIWYYEDVVTNRPVHWEFYTGRSIHVMTFDVGAVLEDEKWQAPVYCFEKKDAQTDPRSKYKVVDVGFLEPQLKGILGGTMQL
ncbi:transferase [Perilla frutescens var. hirtella]|nr:transferase [Perilla frutescens var. hirtella]KAH6815301.1 transferase [Perilla frutescens var. frutescens]